MRCSNCARSSTSLWFSPPAGSSSISSFGPPISARASSTRFCVPNGRLPASHVGDVVQVEQVEQIVQPRDTPRASSCRTTGRRSALVMKPERPR